MKAKVIRMAKQGAPDVMSVESVELNEPGAGEILIRQTAMGLNFMDVYFHRGGQYSVPLPSGLGVEAAGVVEKVGAGVKDFKAGDRVGYIQGAPGAYADYRIMPADRMIKLPEGISEEQAVACMLKGMTAEYLLNRCYPVQKDQYILFMAAAGGVGLMAGQWGKALGAKMIGIAGGPEKCKLALANGYAHVIDRKSEDIAARVKEITGGAGVSAVYDSVGKDTFEISLNALAPRGYFVSFGATTGSPPPVEAGMLVKRGSLYFTRPTLVTYTAKRDDLLASAKAVFDMVLKGSIKLHIGQRYKLDDVVKAHTDLEAGRTQGSSVLTP